MGARFVKPKHYDVAGWATRNDIQCSDGRIIKHGAFDSNDGKKVPVVYNHEHKDIDQVLGHAWLETRPDGVYSYISFNNSRNGKKAKESVMHGDLDELSIYANKLTQNGCNVLKGDIKELSLVIAGANPGAFIDDVCLAHGDDFGDGVLFVNPCTNFTLAHGDDDADDEDYDDEDEVDVDEDEDYDDEEDEDDEETVLTDEEVCEILEGLDPKTQQAVAIALDVISSQRAAEEADENEGGPEEMKQNAFAYDDNEREYLAHMAQFEQNVIADAQKPGIMSMREAFNQHLAADELAHADGDYGITNIDYLFPEYENINGDGAPGFINIRPNAWVNAVMQGVHHTPYSKVKMMFADITTDDEARAKGYIKGKFKKEEVFKLLKRTVDATTIYKKQKMDRDDVISITSFEVIAWIKGEMRMKLNEEIARAILFGDGRPSSSEDKIDETKIIPVVADDDFYCIKKTVTVSGSENLYTKFIDDTLDAMEDYDGSGNLTFFAPASTVNGMLKLKDLNGRRIYNTINELALQLGVDRIVKVPAAIVPANTLGVMVDLDDYNVGADKGGAVNMFDDFDIDFNQMKYLIETKISGALTRPFSAIVFKTAA